VVGLLPVKDDDSSFVLLVVGLLDFANAAQASEYVVHVSSVEGEDLAAVEFVPCAEQSFEVPLEGEGVNHKHVLVNEGNHLVGECAVASAKFFIQNGIVITVCAISFVPKHVSIATYAASRAFFTHSSVSVSEESGITIVRAHAVFSGQEHTNILTSTRASFWGNGITFIVVLKEHAINTLLAVS